MFPVDCVIGSTEFPTRAEAVTGREGEGVVRSTDSRTLPRPCK